MREVLLTAAERSPAGFGGQARTLSLPAVSMNRSLKRLCLALVPSAYVALSLQGCGVPTSTVDLTPGPEPIELTITPTVIQAGGSAQVRVVSPSADSISIESPNGLDRYWSTGSNLRARVTSDFGDSVPGTQFAVRQNGHLFDVLKKPMKVSVCRQGNCRDYFHELPVQLPERNERSVAVTAGWSIAFTKRAVT